MSDAAFLVLVAVGVKLVQRRASKHDNSARMDLSTAVTSTDSARSERTSAELDDRLSALRAAAAALEQEQRELEQEQEQRELAKRAAQPTSRDLELGAVLLGRVDDSGGARDGSDDSALPVATVVQDRERRESRGH